MQFIASYNDFYLDVYSYDLRGYLKPNVYIDMKKKKIGSMWSFCACSICEVQQLFSLLI
jgi:hypothetical protein